MFGQTLSRSNMSIQLLETFGEKIRTLREENEMPLRKLAALLDLDQSTLSKIERNERSANTTLINKIAKIFNVNRKELHVNFLSDQIVYKIIDEEFGAEALLVAENKIAYLKEYKK